MTRYVEDLDAARERAAAAIPARDEDERVSDSVQPVHSWKDSQMTDGRRACSSACAMPIASCARRKTGCR